MSRLGSEDILSFPQVDGRFAALLTGPRDRPAQFGVVDLDLISALLACANPNGGFFFSGGAHLPGALPLLVLSLRGRPILPP